MPDATHHDDPWSTLRQHTAARIALGRAGGSLPTAAVIDFAIAHATARDAVHAALNVDALIKELQELAPPVLLLSTQAADRTTYLRRPDLGRRLRSESAARLSTMKTEACDVAIMIADGLSAPAPQRNALVLLRYLLPRLKSAGLSIAPICVVQQARVAVQDEIGSALAARVSVILIGERPGLGSADSLGAYLVYEPRVGKTDAQRNCISNIREGGLGCEQAAMTLEYLITESLRRRLSGVALKDERALPDRPPHLLN